MGAQGAPPAHRRRDRWKSPRFIVPVAVGVVVVALLATWAYVALAPLVECAVTGMPSGTSGTECVSGTAYRFMTVAAPAAGHTSNVSYAGVSFTLTSAPTRAGPPATVVVNGIESDGSGGTLYLSGGPTAGTGWQTQFSPDGNFGAQAQGGDLASVRLLVALTPSSTQPSPE